MCIRDRYAATRAGRRSRDPRLQSSPRADRPGVPTGSLERARGRRASDGLCTPLDDSPGALGPPRERASSSRTAATLGGLRHAVPSTAPRSRQPRGPSDDSVKANSPLDRRLQRPPQHPSIPRRLTRPRKPVLRRDRAPQRHRATPTRPLRPVWGRTSDPLERKETGWRPRSC